MPRTHTRTRAILSHRGVDTLRTGAAIALGPGWRHAYIRSELACDTQLRRGLCVTTFRAVWGRGARGGAGALRANPARARSRHQPVETAAMWLRCSPFLFTTQRRNSTHYLNLYILLPPSHLVFILVHATRFKIREFKQR